MSDGKPSYEDLLKRIDDLLESNRRLQDRIDELEEKLRSAHRQSAPFRRREAQKKPASEKKKPGRPPGHPGVHREIPTEIDVEIVEPLCCCPHCSGEITDVTERVQYIEECPETKPTRTKLTTYTGHCAQCGEIESTNPLQTSTATGAAGTHLGPRAQALAISLIHQSGLSMKKACDTLWNTYGLKLSAGGLAQLLQRAADRCRGMYDEIGTTLRQSPAVNADETSWYVGQTGWWLWIFTTPIATLYVVDQSHGADVVTQILGDRFRGTLVTDCLASYNAIDCPKHKCIAHHLRVLKEQEESLEKRGLTSSYLAMWKIAWKKVIDIWDQREELGETKFLDKTNQLQREVDWLLERSPAEPEEVRFRDRLRRQREHLLGCFQEPMAEPTNNRAERDLRPAVINRKISCGNRTIPGKTAWEVLRSIAVTVQKRGQSLLDVLTSALSIAPAR